jgi:hypothetical protein
MVYESRAVAPLSELDLDGLVTAAQRRNREEGVTGVLIHDQGRFMQWLEGPQEGVARVWRSIRKDTRHTQVKVLGVSTTPVRLFGGSPMMLRKRKPKIDGRATTATGILGSDVDLPANLLDSLYASPSVTPSILTTLAPSAEGTPRQTRPSSALVDADRRSLLHLVKETIINELVARHALLLRPASIPDPHSEELARLLVAAQPYAAFALIEQLRAGGRSFAQLCGGLFEPSARAMGDLWKTDDCSEFDVALGLCHLQVALRRISLDPIANHGRQLPLSMPHAVLLAPLPREPHMLGSVIASEMFWQAGWDVSCEYPDSDDALGRLVHERWFDVLDLSLSSAFIREHRLPAMAASIRTARAHSRNPGLVVIVDGRIFHERPLAFADVGADAGSTGAQDLISRAAAQIDKRAT